MRRLSKLRLPENVSPDGQDPRTWTEAERDYLTALPEAVNRGAFARAQYDGLDKRKLRVVMYEDQGSICVFCERTIEEKHPAPHIDHWRPLSSNHDLALNWNNLYLSCSTRATCDSAKDRYPLKWDEHDTDLPWPIELAYEEHLGFTSGGEIYARIDTNLDGPTRKALALAIDDQAHGNRRRKAILNLNHEKLVAARAEAITAELDVMNEMFPGKNATKDERDQRATQLLGGNPLPSFVSIRAAWLRDHLGNGR